MQEADTSFSERQIERYLSQIMKAFSHFYVHDGVKRNNDVYYERVPVVYGTPSRVVAAMIGSREEFKNVKVPMMAVNMTSIEVDEENQLNRYHENELSYVRISNDERENVRRIVGKNLRLGIDLHIYASSIQELMQIFENVVLTFNPEVTIQKSSDVFDQDYITSIRLENINNEITQPLGEDSRTVEMTLNFTVPVVISYPAKAGNTLETIKMDIFDDETGYDEQTFLDQLE